MYGNHTGTYTAVSRSGGNTKTHSPTPCDPGKPSAYPLLLFLSLPAQAHDVIHARKLQRAAKGWSRRQIADRKLCISMSCVRLISSRTLFQGFALLIVGTNYLLLLIES